MSNNINMSNKSSVTDIPFFRETMIIAVPVALQSMLQSSFSMIDQIMIGQLGEAQIAAVEVGSRPAFIFSFVSGAVATVCSIMVSQYIGKKDEKSQQRGITTNLAITTAIALIFALVCAAFAGGISGIFSRDRTVIDSAGVYMRTLAPVYIMSGIATIFAVPIRCKNHAKIPLYISALAALINTFLNWVLIFGKMGFYPMGIRGAAIATVISQTVNMLLMLAVFLKVNGKIKFELIRGKDNWKQYLFMLLPVVLNEFLWTVGQSVNTFIYGHLGTDELAAMSLTGPVQGLMIGALSGVAQAAGILIGKRLGKGDYESAYKKSKRLCIYGFAGSVFLSVILIIFRGFYIRLFNVNSDVQSIALQLFLAFAILAPVKVGNMVLGGGVIRSGGRTKYILMIDIIGTWLIGVPLGLLTGIIFKMPIVWVYFILSQEEVFRLLLSVHMFRSKKWMETLK